MKKFLATIVSIICLGTLLIISACSNFTDIANNGEELNEKMTYLDRAKELTENIGELPSLKDIMALDDSANEEISYVSENIKPVAYTVNSHKLNSMQYNEEHIENISVPNDLYYKYPAYDVYYAELWSFIEGSIDSFKLTKESAIENIRQLSVWVKTDVFDSAYYAYRVNYDVNADTVTVESRYEEKNSNAYSYGKIICGYDNDGNISIVAASTGCYEFEGKILWSSMSVTYLENKSWIGVFTRAGDVMFVDEYSYIVEADLTSEDNKITQLYLAKFPNGYGQNLTLNTIINGLPIVYEISLREEENIYGLDQIHIYDENGKNLIHTRYDYNFFENKVEFGLQFAAYKLKGWDNIYYKGDDLGNGDLVIAIGEQEYLHTLSNPQRYEFGDKFNWLPITMVSGVTFEPSLMLENINTEENNIIDCLKQFFESLRLSIDDKYLDTLDKSISCFRNLNCWSAFGVENFTEVYGSCSMDIYNKYSFGEKFDDNFYSIFKQPYILSNEQVEENEIFALIDLVVESNAILNEDTGEINLKDVSAIVPKNILLTEGAEYSLIIALKSSTKVIELCDVSELFLGEQFVLQGFTSIFTKDKVEYDDYMLVTYFAKKSSFGENIRLSKYYYIKASQNNKYIDTWQDQIETDNKIKTYDYTYCIDASVLGITISKYYMISISN